MDQPRSTSELAREDAAASSNINSPSGVETRPGIVAAESAGEISTVVSAGAAAEFVLSGHSIDNSILHTDLDLDFNVDSLNLDNLSGLDFDVSNLLSQVSGSAVGAVVEPSSMVLASDTSVRAEGTKAPKLSTQPETLHMTVSTGAAKSPLPTSTAPMSAAAATPTLVSATQPQTQPKALTAAAERPPPAAAQKPISPSQAAATMAAAQKPISPSQAAAAMAARPAGGAIRPVRPAGTVSAGTAPRPRPGPQARPVAGGSPTAARPASLASPGAGRPPPAMRPGHPGLARPRPVASPTSPASPVRPGMRPLMRPRPTMRPLVSPTAARPAMRPTPRPVMRPASASGAGPASATTMQTTTKPGQLQATSPASAKPAAPESGAAATAATSQEPITIGSDGDGDGDGDAQLLTESVLVSAPAAIASARGLEALYTAEGVFRTLCHGFAPTHAEWSAQNVVAVTWPQLEAEAGGGRRAQRRPGDASREASAAIHLFRLHVRPAPAWDASARLRPMAPALLPLCDVRMQQECEAATPRTLQLPPAALSVAPLSGWHGGASQAGRGQRMPVASAPRCAWSGDGSVLAAWDRGGRFELFQAGAELNAWRPAYRVDFGCPVVACLWLASGRKFGIGRAEGDAKGGSGSGSVSSSGSGSGKRPSRWHVDTAIGISRLAFFGPRNTHGKQALVVATADGQLVLVYQRDDAWARVVSPLSPRRRDASVDDDPWSNIPTGAITHADMMLVSKKWIYLAAHRAGARTVAHPHERGAIADELKRSGAMTAPTVEVYRVQVEFASDYHPRLFATPLVVQPITLTATEAPVAEAMAETEAGAEDLRVPRVTHVKLITALNPEALPADKNVLGENHFFPLLFVSLGRVGNPQPQSAGPQPQSTSNADPLPTFDTFVQVWRLEAAAHAQRSVADLLRRPPPLKLSHMWTEQRRGTLLAVNANRAERQQLRRLFARPSDTEYRALMLTWADGRVEMLRNYQDRADRFDQCVPPVQAQTHTHMRVIGSALSPHYTAYFQLVMAEHTVDVGASAGTNIGPITCVWAQGHARFRLGWTPFFGDAPVQAYCGDLLAVRILNQEDPTDLVALLANIARHEENQPLPPPPPNTTTESTALPVPASRTLAQALLRACTLLGAALRITSLELDPLAASTPAVRRLLGAIMQTHFLAQHSIQATSVGLLLHIAAAVEARVSIVHKQVLQSAASGLAHQQVHQQLAFSAAWRRSFPATAALVLWCIDLFVALVRDTYLYLHARCPDGAGAMQRLCDLDAGVDDNTDDSTDAEVVAGSLPSRLALLFHLPTLDAMRQLMAFVAQVEGDLLRRIQILNSLPPNAAAIPDLAPMVQARDMVVATAQQLAHALEALPVSMQRMKDFLAAVHDEYAADPECTALGAQAVLVASAALAAPFRKHLPGVARSFQRFILERDATAPDTPANRPAAPSALVLHDTRWLSVVACRAAAPGLPDAATVFETPWRVQLPVSVADARLIAAGADADALVPAAELAAWAREKSEFERALDEDNVLFDIDDPGFIFFDTSDAAQPLHPPPELVPPAFAAAVAHAAAQAPVRITTRVPDFSDVLAPLAAAAAVRSSAADIDGLFDMPALLDSTFAAAAATATAADITSSARMRVRSSSSSATTHSPCATPHTTASFAWPPPGAAPGFALASASGSASAQHFVPHYSSVASAWAATADAGASEELSSGWQFISTPRDPKLHIPTLLGQHAYSLAVLHQKSTRAPVAVGGSGSKSADNDNDDNDDDNDSSGIDINGDGMSYCIDWSRADGVVIDPLAAPAHSGSALAAAGDAESGARSRNFMNHTSLLSAMDRIDVVQKTMLPVDASSKMCLRCGHVTRKQQQTTSGAAANTSDSASSASAASNDIGWIDRFRLLCVCGGSWIAI